MKEVAQSTTAPIKMPCPVGVQARHRKDRWGRELELHLIDLFGLMPLAALHQFKFDFLTFG